jgi:hypothetical protein
MDCRTRSGSVQRLGADAVQDSLTAVSAVRVSSDGCPAALEAFSVRRSATLGAEAARSGVGAVSMTA